jgi:hypothetical protein
MSENSKPIQGPMRPCPCCGEPNRINAYQEYVSCCACGTSTREVDWLDDDAVTRWNTRPIEDHLRRLIKEWADMNPYWSARPTKPDVDHVRLLIQRTQDALKCA